VSREINTSILPDADIKMGSLQGIDTPSAFEYFHIYMYNPKNTFFF